MYNLWGQKHQQRNISPKYYANWDKLNEKKSLDVCFVQEEYNDSDFIYLFIYLCFLGLHLQHMEVSKLGVESELQLSTYATATAM